MELLQVECGWNEGLYFPSNCGNEIYQVVEGLFEKKVSLKIIMIKSIFKYAWGWVEVYHYDLGFCWLHLFIYRTSIGQKNWKQGFCIGRFRKEKPRTKITPHSEEEAYPLVTFTNLSTYGEQFHATQKIWQWNVW